MQGWGYWPAEIQGLWPHSWGSGCPGCWPKPLLGHFLHLRKRRMGRKVGQGRWPGQVALVSSCHLCCPPH